MSVLDDEGVRKEMLRAWLDSEPGTDSGHEEGGFVLRGEDCSLFVERWPQGADLRILVPDHPGGKRAAALVLATFHTHPNTGIQFAQWPSEQDIVNIMRDDDLSHPEYEGEFVISAKLVYLVRKTGRIEVPGETDALLGSA